MKEKQEGIEKFFEILGEMWRDICLIEFLMRCAVAQESGDAEKFPRPPYTKDKVYSEYPESFAIGSFEKLVKEYNEHFQNDKIPQIIIDLRHAMAHGVIAKINGADTDELIKFKLQKDKTLKIEFNTSLEISKLEQLRKSLHPIRKIVQAKAADK